MAGIEGYIKLYRALRLNKLWQEKPYTRGQAWVDMLLRCNHVCTQMGPQYQSVWILRGQFLLSNVKLADAWGWSERTVRRFMEYLENESMVKIIFHNKFTVYEVLKYAELQALDTELFETVARRADAEQTPSKRRARAEQTPTNNNDNNNKNEKKYKEIYKEIVLAFTNDIELQNTIREFIKHRESIKKPIRTEHTMKLLFSELTKLSKDPKVQIEILNQSIVNGWQGIFELKKTAGNKTPGKPSYMDFNQREYMSDDEFFTNKRK